MVALGGTPMLVAGFETTATLELQILRIAVAGTHGPTRSVQFFEWVAEEAVRLGVNRVLMDVVGVGGDVSTPDRFDLGVALARIPAKVAVIAQPTMIDAERFGEIVGRNRGADGRVFATEAEALAWLTLD
jgi:hypothetical protein